MQLARLYVTDLTKIIVAQLIIEYEVKIVDEIISSLSAWGVLRAHYPGLSFLSGMQPYLAEAGTITGGYDQPKSIEEDLPRRIRVG